VDASAAYGINLAEKTSRHTCAPDFFQGGGGGVIFVDPIFNGPVFSKKKKICKS
jgi:hypothetical protein